MILIWRNSQARLGFTTNRRRRKFAGVRMQRRTFENPANIAIWFCVASNFAQKRPSTADFPSRFRTTQNQIAILSFKKSYHSEIERL